MSTLFTLNEAMPEEEANTFADDENSPNYLYRSTAMVKAVTTKNEDADKLKKLASTSFENIKMRIQVSIIEIANFCLGNLLFLKKWLLIDQRRRQKAV